MVTCRSTRPFPVGRRDVNVEAVMPGDRHRLRVQRDRLARSDALAAQAGRRLPREFLGELDDQRLHGGGLLSAGSAPRVFPRQLVEVRGSAATISLHATVADEI